MKNFDKNASNLRDVVQSSDSFWPWFGTVWSLKQYSSKWYFPYSTSDDTLEESVISVLADIDIYLEHQYIEACHRFGKADRQK